MNKRKFLTHLGYTWWIYVLSAIIIALIWWWIFSAVSQPKATEKLSVTLVVGKIDEEKFKSGIEDALPQISEQKIKKVEVNIVVYESDYALSNALWARTLDSDIIIISESFLFDNIGNSFFNGLDEKSVNSNFGEVKTYKENEVIFGIEVYAKNRHNKFAEYYQNIESCYLFFGSGSENTGLLNGNGKAENDAALKIAGWLVGGVE